MANGLLEELRRIAESSKDIPQESVNRLILSALADLVVKVDRQTENEETKQAGINTAIEEVRDATAILSQQVTEISTKLTVLTMEIASLRENPVVSVGRFIKRHPKTALFLAVGGIAAALILLSSKPFVVLVLTLAGVPGTAIEQIIQLLTINT